MTSPQYGGTACPTSHQRQRCNSHACPLDCVEGQWAQGTCSKSCGAGTYTVTRNMRVRKQPKYGGVACGAPTQTFSCNHGTCPINCDTDAWTGWSTCTKSCGTGSQKRKRKVSDVAVDGQTCHVTGKSKFHHDVAMHQRYLTDGDCTGTTKDHVARACPALRDTQDCNVFACVVDCNVGSWSRWSTCSHSCSSSGSGAPQQTRSRTLQQPRHGGKACPSVRVPADRGYTTSQSNTQDCNSHACPTDCAVGSWGSWGSCLNGRYAHSCGAGGKQIRTRKTVEPENGGKKCPVPSERQDCNTHPCPIDCEVNSWRSWSACSGSCGEIGVNSQTRARTIKVAVRYGGKACPTLAGSQQCNVFACPTPCQGAWSAWSTCSASCEMKEIYRGKARTAGGARSPTQTRTHVIRKKAMYGGKQCFDDQVQTCNTHGCPIDCVVGRWTAWSAWSHSCGGATRYATRTVTQPVFGGKTCPITRKAMKGNNHACPTPSPSAVPTTAPTNMPYPIINVIGGDLITVEATTDLQQSYDDEGATCFDTHDQDLTQNVVVMGDIVNLIDAFSDCRHIQYECTNTAGLTSSKIRTVCVKDTNCPTCTMNNPTVQKVTVEASFPYVDAGAECSDAFDGEKPMVKRYNTLGEEQGGVDVEMTGTYVITYTATDDSNNDCREANPRRTVVVMDTLKPVIGLQYGDKFMFKSGNQKHTLGTPARTRSMHESFQNYFALMAEASTGSSAFVLGAIASAVSGVALVSYAAQQRSTSAVADLV